MEIGVYIGVDVKVSIVGFGGKLDLILCVLFFELCNVLL